MSSQFSISNDTGFDIRILAGTALAGLAMKLFFSQEPSKNGMSGPASAAVWGYGTILLSLTGMLIVSFALTTRKNISGGLMSFLKGLLSSSLPTVLMVVIITWLLSQSINYYTRINKGDVAPEYNAFSTASSILVAIQLLVLLKFLYDTSKSATASAKGSGVASDIYSALSSQMSTIGYVLAFVNILITGIMQVILAFFSTDG